MHIRRTLFALVAVFALAMPAPSQQIVRFTYAHLTQATANNLLATQSAYLHTIVVNASTSGTLALVDTTASNCSGGTAISGTTGSLSAGQTLVFDVVTKKGLCITTGGTVDVTVTWRIP